MANEVIQDVYRDEDHGPRVELERLNWSEPVLSIPTPYLDQIHNLVEVVADEVYIPHAEVTRRVNRMIDHMQAPSIFIALWVNRVIRGLIIAEVGDTANTSHVGWLRMEVHPSFRSQGYGKLLLDAMFVAATAQKLKRLEITSYAPNSRARKFFLRNGFVIEGHHKLARRDPETGQFIDTYTLAATL